MLCPPQLFPSSSSRPWSASEDEKLYAIVEAGEKEWDVISRALGRTDWEVRRSE